MDVVAGVSQLRDLFGQQFHAIDGIAEDDGLIDLKLGEESVETVNLLTFLYVGVELGDTPEGELVHEIDGVGVGDEFLAKVLDCDGERGTEQTNLMIGVAQIDNFLQYGLKLRGEELVGLVHDDGAAFAEIRHIFRGQVENATGRGHNHVNLVVETHDIVFE
jgi:hypothetical protein